MPTLVVITGPIASGKSTLAGALGERFRASGRRAAVLDLDELVETIGGFVGLPGERFHQAQMVFGQLVGAWLDQGFDVIAHGPFFHRDEDMALLHAIPDGVKPRRVLLQTTFAVALERVRADPERPTDYRAGATRRRASATADPRAEQRVVLDLLVDRSGGGRLDPTATLRPSQE